MEQLIISKIKELKVLTLGFILCAFFLALRIKTTGSFFFLFLAWNLFLAYIPYGISLVLQAYPKLQSTRWKLIPLVGIWLLFLPNTPYILSDLQHLRHSEGRMIWFDILLLVCFSWYALFIFVMTIRDMQQIISSKWRTLKTRPLMIIIFLLCGFGIYLGRVLRWNSWDIVQHPLELAGDIWYRIRHPLKNIQTWGITFGYGGLLSLIYYATNATNIDER